MEEREILALLEARSETALDRLTEQYAPLCRQIAREILGSPEDAEECWNDALLRLWNSVPPERPRHLRAYLAKLTRHAAIDRLPADEQLLLHLYYYDDRPLRDIAYIMDAEPGLLATRLHRIRKKLLLMMKENEQ